MAIDRRTFLQYSAFVSSFAFAPRSFATLDTEFILGTCRLSEDQYGISKVNLDGELQWQLALPARGHDIVVHPSGSIAVAIARRPGQFIVVFDIDSGKTLKTVEVPKTLKLNGHAVWDDDRLIVSASDRETSQMILLEYRLSSSLLIQIRQKTYDYYGPHELLLINHEIVVAVGGLKTDGRSVLNKHKFESLILKLDANTLSPNSVITFPTHHVSFRHLSADANGNLYIAGQYQLESDDSEPLLFVWHNEMLAPVNAPATLWKQLKGYIGSIKVINDRFVVTSPRAHWLGVFNCQTLTLDHQLLSNDICALAQSGDRMIAGSGTGKLWIDQHAVQSSVAWDNHFVSV